MKNNRLRAMAREFLKPNLTVFCAIFCASLIPMYAAAQDTPATQSSPIQIENIVARPIPTRTVGLEPGKVVKWTIRDAIMTALEKNIDIELERENVRMMQYDLISQQGFYDPTTTSRILFNQQGSPTASRDQGLDGGNTISSKSLTYNFGMVKEFERWGSRLQGDFFNTRSNDNRSVLDTAYNNSILIQFSQPLFRDFKIDSQRRLIKITKKNMDLNDAQFRARVIQIISEVRAAYWNLSLAIKNEAVQRNSVGLAETFLNNTKRQVEVGTLAPIEVVSAATTLESRRQAVLQQMEAVARAENALKNLTAGGPKDELWSSVIEPVEPFDIKQEVSIPIADAINLANENRPEIRQLNLRKDINKIDVDFFRNQAKPQIDLIASYRTDGLAGTGALRPVGNCTGGSTALPVLGPDNKTIDTNCVNLGLRPDGSGGYVLAPFNAKQFVITPTPPVADQFVGSYGTALGNLFKNQFRTWSVGVQIALPLRNRTAKANLGKSLEAERQIDLQTRQLLQNIEVEVRNALQAVETAKLRVDAAQEAERYAKQQLEGEEKKFNAGLQTTYFVLARQNELLASQVSTLQAKADYNIAITNLQRVMSTTLSSNGIELKQEAPVTIK
jgi:outer membrane protein